jgi:hypothetical protein
LAPTIQEIKAAGIVSLKAIAAELNRRRVPTFGGGKRWYITSVVRLLARLRRLSQRTSRR